MKRKRTRRITPIALLWTRGDQRRFTDVVEKLVAHVNDLAVILSELKELHQARSRRRRQAPVA